MKVIIIQDTDARALLTLLELNKMRAANHWPNNTKATNDAIIEAHRSFHFIVTRWLQEQGADVVGG